MFLNGTVQCCIKYLCDENLDQNIIETLSVYNFDVWSNLLPALFVFSGAAVELKKTLAAK